MKQPIVNLKDLRVCIEPANVYGNGIDLRDAESVKKFCRAQDGYVKINRIFFTTHCETTRKKCINDKP